MRAGKLMLFCFRLSSEFEKCSTSSSCPSHRVTFNDKNEVASQEEDGGFTVTYSQLGERISQRKTGGQPGLKVQYSQRSNLDFPQLRLSDQTRNVTFDEESFQSYKR